MFHKERKYSARLFCGAAIGALAMFSTPAWSQEFAPIDIAPQPLAKALGEFAAQTKRAVLVTPDLTVSRTSSAVSGETDPETALVAMLEGTGLTYRRDGETFLIVKAAQDPQSGSAAGDGADGTVEALIVTAQKREEDIQDVPIAISAFTQEALETHQIAGGPDLMTQIPNFTFTKTNFTSYSIQLRGIGTQAISATTDPAVAIAFNNTPFVRNRFFEQEFYDLQRVEVLRGPQGTLYGRNATAGVVNIISQKPKFNYEAKASGDVSNYSSTRIEGMVNIPLVEDKVAMRLAGAWTKRDGYVTNEITGNPIDGRDLWSTRLSLRFAPTDRLDANLIWEHFEEDDDRLRSGKQTCKKHVVTQLVRPEINGHPGLVVDVSDDPYQIVPDYGSTANARTSNVQSLFSQGCLPSSLYSPDSFQTPNGHSIPYYYQLAQIGLPVKIPAFGERQFDPYLRETQSQDLRVIESTVDPIYRAKTDVVEFQFTYDLTDTLSLTSETAWASDFIFSSQDFNRFNTAPGAFSTLHPNGSQPSNGVMSGALDQNGVFCDPQVGCADRLVAVDLSTANSQHFSQEFRIASDFDGPFNFSLGSNFLRYDTEDKYYVFINSLTLTAVAGRINSLFLEPFYVPGVTTNADCLKDGPIAPSFTEIYDLGCVHIDPNPITSLNDQGHNYFLSRNPFKLISYAVFGEAYYNIADNLKVTAGLRWTVDKKQAPRIPSWVLAGQTVGYPVHDVTEQEWREPTGRLAVDWKPDLAFTDETMIYASYAHGYKAGGANPPPFGIVMYNPSTKPPAFLENYLSKSATHPKTFDAEYVDAFELGSKNTLLDGALTLNLAAFYYDYRNYQISQIVNRSAVNLNFDAKVWGLEIEADWRPLENFRLGFKGGYENTEVADGERAIDIMDRTAGEEGWMVVRPFPTFPSNCILPSYVYMPIGGSISSAADGQLFGPGSPNGGGLGGCELAYVMGFDPVLYAPFGGPPDPLRQSLDWWANPAAYPGFDPLQPDINLGQGFYKELGGNELPNAPNFTATITADYTIPLPNDWLATLHTDLYYQSEAWTRIFNMEGYDKLKAYSNINLAAIFTNDEAGWKVMAYVKNVLDRDSITGAFLNSDDTGLTTNVFLTEPRLYGLRVTKEWRGGPLLGGFGSRHSGPAAFTVELGGQVQRQDASYETLRAGFEDDFPDALDVFDQAQNKDFDWGDGREVKLTLRPNAGRWLVSAEMRTGEVNNDTSRPYARTTTTPACAIHPDLWPMFGGSPCVPGHPLYELAGGERLTRFTTNWASATARDHEEHEIFDLSVGYDLPIVGLSSSVVSAGLRKVSFESTTWATMGGIHDRDIPPGWYLPLGGNFFFHEYTASMSAERSFEGAGPVVKWDASLPLLGGDDTGRVELDWSLSGGVLFGDQETRVVGEGIERTRRLNVGPLDVADTVYDEGTVALPALDITPRSEEADVTTFGASLGLSYRIDRLKLGAGYRWERYQDVLDVGQAEAEQRDRTIDGPYFRLSFGFGG